jgi:hypothetical protein
VNFAYMLVSCKRHISIVGERETTARASEGRPPGWGARGGGEISYCEENFSKRDANKRERGSFSRVSVFILPEYVQSNTQIELKHTFQLVLLSSTSLSLQPVMKCFCQSERATTDSFLLESQLMQHFAGKFNLLSANSN